VSSSVDTFHATAWMALLCALFYGSGQWYFVIPMGILISVCALFQDAINHELFWLAVCLLVGSTLLFNWFILGNHDYLVAYWCLALFLSRLTQESESVLAVSGRWLIAIVFTLAVFWKVTSPEFLSGEFFNLFLLHDYRLAPVGALLTALSLEDVRANSKMLPQYSFGEVPSSISLTSVPQIHLIARVFAWMTVVLEGLVATAFMFSSKFGRWRDVILLLFMFGTYMIAPVAPFGTILCSLGYAQSSSASIRRIYLFFFIVVQVMFARLFLVPF
jgi:hypothetical protein